MIVFTLTAGKIFGGNPSSTSILKLFVHLGKPKRLLVFTSKVAQMALNAK